MGVDPETANLGRAVHDVQVTRGARATVMGRVRRAVRETRRGEEKGWKPRGLGSLNAWELQTWPVAGLKISARVEG